MRKNTETLFGVASLGFFALVTMSASGPVLAQPYPQHQVQMIVPFPAGGPVDVVARAFAQAMDQQLGQPVVVLNREGGSTTVGMNALLNAAPDGYTLVYGPVTALTVHTHWMKNLQFKFDSFTPVCQTFENIFFLAAGPKSPYANFEALLKEAKARPGALTYAHPGIASSPHLAGAELFQKAGVSLADVPFRGETPMLTQLLNREVDFGVVTTGLVTTHSLRPFAVFADKRLAAYPDVPTVKELGYAVTPSGFGGLFVRKDTPAAVVARVESACRGAVQDPKLRDAAKRQYQETEYLGSSDFAARILADYRSKEALLKTVKIE